MVDSVFVERIGAAVQLGQAGDRASARRRFAELWNEAGSDAFQRCLVAHYPPDVQEEARDELAWDLRAWDVVDRLTATAGSVTSPRLASTSASAWTRSTRCPPTDTAS